MSSVQVIADLRARLLQEQGNACARCGRPNPYEVVRGREGHRLLCPACFVQLPAVRERLQRLTQRRGDPVHRYVKWQAYERDGGCCRLCRRALLPAEAEAMVIDRRLVPELANVITVCARCAAAEEQGRRSRAALRRGVRQDPAGAAAGQQAVAERRPGGGEAEAAPGDRLAKAGGPPPATAGLALDRAPAGAGAAAAGRSAHLVSGGAHARVPADFAAAAGSYSTRGGPAAPGRPLLGPRTGAAPEGLLARRRRLFAESGGRCNLCGTQMAPGTARLLVLHHGRPLGSDNVILVCPDCRAGAPPLPHAASVSLTPAAVAEFVRLTGVAPRQVPAAAALLLELGTLLRWRRGGRDRVYRYDRLLLTVQDGTVTAVQAEPGWSILRWPGLRTLRRQHLERRGQPRLDLVTLRLPSDLLSAVQGLVADSGPGWSLELWLVQLLSQTVRHEQASDLN